MGFPQTEAAPVSNIAFHQIRYNRQIAAFEAKVDVLRGDVVFRYPCRVHGPEDMPAPVLHSSFVRAALQMSDSGDAAALPYASSHRRSL